MNLYQQILAKSRYARYLDKEKRRETWEETVDRLIDYLQSKVPDTLPIPWTELKENILSLKVMPSMRLLMTAGEAVERDNIAAYNCAYLAVNNKRAFSVRLYTFS